MSQAKNEAKELVDRFYISKILNTRFRTEEAKQCALICVDEKQKTIDKMFNGYHTMPKEWRKEYDELEEVNQEILKL